MKKALQKNNRHKTQQKMSQFFDMDLFEQEQQATPVTTPAATKTTARAMCPVAARLEQLKKEREAKALDIRKDAKHEALKKRRQARKERKARAVWTKDSMGNKLYLVNPTTGQYDQDANLCRFKRSIVAMPMETRQAMCELLVRTITESTNLVCTEEQVLGLLKPFTPFFVAKSGIVSDNTKKFLTESDQNWTRFTYLLGAMSMGMTGGEEIMKSFVQRTAIKSFVMV